MRSILRHASFLILPLFLLVILTTSVFALGKPQGDESREASRGQSASNIRISPEGGKLRSCQAKEAAVKQRMTHLTRLVTNMETKFDTIAARVENYYTNKVVPSGKTVPNYSVLVTDIQTKKTAVQTALTKAQTDSDSFSCTSGTPKTQLTQFRVDMQAVKKALKDYRTSIKNLTVAVHSVTGVENSKRSGSPKPTKSPKEENK